MASPLIVNVGSDSDSDSDVWLPSGPGKRRATAGGSAGAKAAPSTVPASHSPFIDLGSSSDEDAVVVPCTSTSSASNPHSLASLLGLTLVPPGQPSQLPTLPVLPQRSSAPLPQPKRGRTASRKPSTGGTKRERVWRPPSPPPAAATPWHEAFAPVDSVDLAWHKPRLREVQACMSGEHPQRPCLLFLVGPPGTGKSTALQVCAKEAGVPVHRWSSEGGQGGAQGGYLPHTTTQAPMEAFQRQGDADVEWVDAGGCFDALLGSASAYAPLAVAGSDSTPPAHKPQLTSRRQGCGPHSVILLDSVPRTRHGAVGDAALRAVSDHLRRSAHSSASTSRALVAVCVSSGPAVGETACLPSLVREWGADIVHHPRSLVLTLPPVPPGRMRRALARVANLAGARGVGGSVKRRRTDSTRAPHGGDSDDLLRCIAEGSSGDLRHAINTLQLLVGHDRRGSGERDALTSASHRRVRDAFLPPLHALGKLLYAKRDPETGVLESDPDHTAASTAYDGGTVAAFLAHNAPDFFTDIGHFATAADTWATADRLAGAFHAALHLGRRADDPGLGEDAAGAAGASTSPATGTVAVSAEAYALTLSARAAAVANAAPAPRAFRPLRKPPLFALHALRRDNLALLRQGVCNAPGARTSMRDLLTDTLPAQARMPNAPALARAMAAFGPTRQSLLTRAGCGGLPLGAAVPGGGWLVGHWGALTPTLLSVPSRQALPSVSPQPASEERVEDIDDDSD